MAQSGRDETDIGAVTVYNIEGNGSFGWVDIRWVTLYIYMTVLRRALCGSCWGSHNLPSRQRAHPVDRSPLFRSLKLGHVGASNREGP